MPKNFSFGASISRDGNRNERNVTLFVWTYNSSYYSIRTSLNYNSTLSGWRVGVDACTRIRFCIQLVVYDFRRMFVVLLLFCVICFGFSRPNECVFIVVHIVIMIIIIIIIFDLHTFSHTYLYIRIYGYVDDIHYYTHSVYVRTRSSSSSSPSLVSGY